MDNLWNKFMISGSVADYLKYKYNCNNKNLVTENKQEVRKDGF